MKKQTAFWIVALLAVIAAAAVLAPLQMMPYGRDQALFATVAQVMERQSLSVQDVWIVRAPGIFLWMSGVRRLVGPYQEHARRAEWAWMVLPCLAAALAAHAWTRRSLLATGLAPVLLAIRYAGGGFTHTLQPSGLALLPLLLALGVWGPPGRERPFKRIAVAGLLLGCATIFAGEAVWLGIALVVVEFLAAARGAALKRANRATTIFSLTLLLPPLTSFFWMVAINQWSLLAPTINARIQEFTTPPPLFPADLLVVALLGLLFWKVKESRQAAASLVTGLLTLFVIVAVFESPGDALLLEAPLVLAGTMVIVEAGRWLARQRTPTWLRGAALTVFALTLVLGGPFYAVGNQWRQFRDYLAGMPDIAWGAIYSDKTTSFDYIDTRRAAGVLEEEAARLRQSGSVDPRLFVWGAEPGLYHFSQLHPATRYLTHQPILTGDQDREQDLLNLLNQRPPEFFAVRKNDFRLPLFNGATDSRAELRRRPALHKFLTDHYELICDLYGFDIYRHRNLLLRPAMPFTRAPQRPGPPPSDLLPASTPPVAAD